MNVEGILSLVFFIIGLFVGLVIADNASKIVVAREVCTVVFGEVDHSIIDDEIFCLVEGKYESPYKPIDKESD